MNDNEKKFLEENFKAGEYMSLTILVKNEEAPKLIDGLKKLGLNLAILPNVQAAVDFNDPNHEGTEQ